jgi:hypothetical protein
MPSLIENVLGFNAFCSFNADAGAPAFFTQRGFANPGFTRNGAGDYTLTLQDGVNTQTQGVVLMGVQNNAPALISVEFLTTTTLRVRTLSATTATPPVLAAADVDFWLMVMEAGPN